MLPTSGRQHSPALLEYAGGTHIIKHKVTGGPSWCAAGGPISIDFQSHKGKNPAIFWRPNAPEGQGLVLVTTVFPEPHTVPGTY